MVDNPHRLRPVADAIATRLSEYQQGNGYPGLDALELAEQTDICILSVIETLDLMLRAGLVRPTQEFYTRSPLHPVTLTKAGIRHLLPASEVDAALEATGTRGDS